VEGHECRPVPGAVAGAETNHAAKINDAFRLILLLRIAARSLVFAKVQPIIVRDIGAGCAICARRLPLPGTVCVSSEMPDTLCCPFGSAGAWRQQRQRFHTVLSVVSTRRAASKAH
jgi:hypothetical protein